MIDILACTTHNYHGHSLQRALEGISRAGLRFVEIAAASGVTEHVKPEDMDRRQLTETKKWIEGYGLTVASISGHCDLTTPRGQELFRARIEMATWWGVPIVNAAAGNIDTAKGRDAFFAAMRRIMPVLEQSAVLVCLETDHGIVGPSEEILQTLKRIGSEKVRINFDPANVVYHFGRDPVAELAKIAHQVGHVHLKDNRGGQGVSDFPALGSGSIDLGGIIRELRRARYQGPVSIEIEFDGKGAADPAAVDEALIQSLGTLRALGEAP
jgi:sugar phosphate isomerase/epimerase